MMTWMGWRLFFICSEDPSALNKIQVRPALLEKTKNGGRSVSLGFSRGQSQSQPISSILGLISCGQLVCQR